MNDPISEYIKKLTDKNTPHENSCDMISSSVHQISVPIPAELFKQLKAMSAEYKRDAECVAGELLTISLRQAMAALSIEDIEHLTDIRLAYQNHEMENQEEATGFDAGGT